jgi:hypothetical protein
MGCGKNVKKTIEEFRKFSLCPPLQQKATSFGEKHYPNSCFLRDSGTDDMGEQGQNRSCNYRPVTRQCALAEMGVLLIWLGLWNRLPRLFPRFHQEVNNHSDGGKEYQTTASRQDKG